MDGADESYSGRFEIRPRLSYVVDKETGYGTGIEVFVLRIARAEYLDAIPVW
jgi:hypothetical protein